MLHAGVENAISTSSVIWAVMGKIISVLNLHICRYMQLLNNGYGANVFYYFINLKVIFFAALRSDQFRLKNVKLSNIYIHMDVHVVKFLRPLFLRFSLKQHIIRL